MTSGQRWDGLYSSRVRYLRLMFLTGEDTVKVHSRVLSATGAALLLASCASSGGNGSGGNVHPPTSGTSAPAPLFLRRVDPPLRPGMLPVPYIGRATEGVLSVDRNGCVLVRRPEFEALIIWPSDAAFDRREMTFRTKSSGVLRLGDWVSFTANPSGPLRTERIGDVHVPEACRRMNTIWVAPDGARKL